MPKYHRKKSYHKKIYPKKAPPKRHYPLRTFITILAIIFSIFALGAFIAFLSPSMFINLMMRLPPDIQEAIFVDIFLRGGTGLWVFLLIAAILWYARSKIRS